MTKSKSVVEAWERHKTTDTMSIIRSHLRNPEMVDSALGAVFTAGYFAAGVEASAREYAAPFNGSELFELVFNVFDGDVPDDLTEARIDDLARVIVRAFPQIDGAGSVAWACSRWQAEVAIRPLKNIYRRALDTTWRQVVRHFGGDPEKLLGPSHDELVAASTAAR